MTVNLEAVLSKANLSHALKQVLANKGAPGVDGMNTEELVPYIKAHPNELSQAIMDGTYRPSPVKRVYIPKENGDKRPLGIPTVRDRLIQQALAQKIAEEFEPRFSDSSYGFRPNLSALDAVQAVVSKANQGYEYVIDLDLSKFFDTVNHSKMIQVLSDRIRDGRVISLIHRFFRAKIEEEGRYTKPVQGMPQGGPLSPICANCLLNELDQELEKRGHKFVRYADDMCILFKSKRAAERTFISIKKFIEQKLFLEVNEDKTKICHLSQDVKFLGYTFYKRRNKDSGGEEWKTAVHKKSRKKFKNTVREILDRRCPLGLEKCKSKLRKFITGWANYFKYGLTKSGRLKLDQWIRRRIRQMYWKIWKTPRTRVRALVKFGIPKGQAYQWGNSSKAYWRIAGSWVLSSSLTVKRLESQGGWVWLENCRAW